MRVGNPEPFAQPAATNSLNGRGASEDGNAGPEALQERVLVFTPTGRDGQLTCDVLAGEGLNCVACPDIETCCAELERGAGVAIVAEEALRFTAAPRLLEAIAAQPPWSDLPLVIFTRGDSSDNTLLETLKEGSSVTLLERPVRITTLVSAVRSALRARRRQYEVRDLLQRLEEDARRKDEFLAMLGHELRNPLAAAGNALAVLHHRPAADERAARHVEIIDRQVHNLSRMVDDLLDVSRVSMGKITLQLRPVDLREVARGALDSVRAAAEAQRHEVTLRLPPEPVRVHGDTVRLEQVATNLLSNAVKYTPPGGQIVISVEEDGARAVLRIRDNGIGIPPEMLTRVFDLFTQARTSLDRQPGGLGLGLTLVRSLVRMHGGEISPSSEGPDRGSEFVVRLPILDFGLSILDLEGVPESARLAGSAEVFGSAEPDPQSDQSDQSDQSAIGAVPNPKSKIQNPKSKRVLVVEDNADGRETLRDLLELWGYRVELAETGAEGVERAVDIRPDIALVDIGLPGIDGYEVARLVRRALPGCPLRLIAMTGYGQPEDRERALDAGFDAYLVKPVKAEELEGLLAEG
jgi:signal transduction histidine kinase